MARISFSPLIVSASGKVQDTVFSRWKGKPYIRSRVTPSNPKSTDQVKQRAIMTAAVGLWQKLHPNLKAAWAAYASGYGISGYNACTQRNAKTAIPSGDGTYARLQDACANVLDLAPSDSAVPEPVAFAAVTGVTTVGSIDCSWTHGGYADGDMIHVTALADDATSGILEPPPAATSQYAADATGTLTIYDLGTARTYSVFASIYDVGTDSFSPATKIADVSPKAA